MQRGGVDRDLVGARIQQAPHILDPAHTAPNRERDKDFAGNRFDHRKNQVPIIARRSNVQKGQFVRPLSVVTPGNFDGIAGVTQFDKIDPLDDSSSGDIKARNDSAREHPVKPRRRMPSKPNPPA